MANGDDITPTTSSRVRWVIARPGRTLTLAGVIAVASGFGATIVLFGSGDAASRLMLGAASLLLLAVAVIALLTDSVFVGHGRVRPGRGRGWTPLTNAADLAVVARQANVVCLAVGRGESARVLLTSTSALGFTKADDLHGAVRAARLRVLDAAGVPLDPDDTERPISRTP
jgi:hypothetical protein